MNLRELNRRVPSAEDFIRFDPASCVACGACVRVCVVRIWTLEPDDSSASLAADYRQRCLECGACDQACDARAITFRYPPGGTGVVFEQG